MSASSKCQLIVALLLVRLAEPAWVLAWSDEFSGGVVNASNWNVLNNTAEGRPPTWNQIEVYDASNVFVDDSDGHSALVLRTQPADITIGGVHYNISSGRVDSSFKRNVTFGRIEVSARLQNDAISSGIHTAHWMLGYGCWPPFGEIDIMECQSPGNEYVAESGSAPAGYQVVTSNYHWGPECRDDVSHTSGTSAFPRERNATFNLTTDYTVYSVEWNSTALVFSVNETIVNRVYEGMPGWAVPVVIPSWPMYLILSQAYMAKRPQGDPPAWAWPIEQRIDYVRVYEWQ